MSLDVVVVGSAVRDEYYTLSNLPEPDGRSFVHGFEEAVGGVGANVAVAAINCRGHTAQPGLPTRDEIEAFRGRQAG